MSEESLDSVSAGSGSGGLTRGELLKGAAVGAGLLGMGGLVSAGGAGAATRRAHGAVGARAVKRGGNLQVGLGGGGAADTLDAHLVRSTVDVIRHNALYDQLTQVNHSFDLVYRLATEITSNKKGDLWTVRLRKGVEFHDGKTLDAEDAIFSIRRILTLPGSTGAGQLFAVDYKNMRKIDKLTFQIPTKIPFSTLVNSLGDGSTNFIVPVGYDPNKPVGTGPFMYESFSPGQRSVFKRNPNYWDTPAYLDTLTLIDLTDDTARMNALTTGAVQVIDDVPTDEVAVIKGNSKLKLLVSPTGGFSPIYMRTDKPPFSDNRVRQAMRLILNRPQAVEHAMGGYGRVGNDLVSPYDPGYLPKLHRVQDLEKAKSLLKQAGHENLSVVLNTSPVTPSTVPGTEVLAQNASEIGVKITLHQIDPGTLYGKNFLSWDFAVDWYPALSYIDESSLLTAGKIASTNLAHFNDPTYNKLFMQALAELNATKRNDIIHEMEMI
ncbi:MAG: ABC transporter substrate-binding protein, partial [Solirubrobacteraceae bacterium]